MQSTHENGEDESSAEDVDGLRELLDHVAPHQAHRAEQHHDHPGQRLRTVLAVKVLGFVEKSRILEMDS